MRPVSTDATRLRGAAGLESTSRTPIPIMATEASPMDRGLAWLGAGDTGLSSETMCLYFISGRAPERLHGFRRISYPLDPSDFGRCVRLLAAVPEWRARLPELAALSPEWDGLVANWDRLEALYWEELPAKTAPRLYAAMHELEAEARFGSTLKPTPGPTNG